MTYFRIQTSDRDTAELVSAERDQVSHSWYASENYDRPGVSACRSPEELAFYLAHSAIPYGIGEWVIVEMTGEIVEGASPMDARVGEVLIWPSAIVSIRPLDDEMFEMIGAAFDALLDGRV